MRDESRLPNSDNEVPDDYVHGWYAVVSSSELRGSRPLSVERFGLRWVLFRHSRGVSAFEDRCPHRGVRLSGGKVQNDRIVCPFHGFEFDADGACRLIPAQGEAGPIPKAMRARASPALEAHGFIFVWWGDVPDTLPPVDWFGEELDRCFGPYEFWKDTDVGLSRNIENQLDMIHLPFVHRRTIGRFFDSPQMEVDTTVDGNRIRAFRRGDPDFFVEVRLPNLWINQIGKRAYVVLAFAPIRRAQTRLYARYYQGRLRVPVLRDVLGWVSHLANRVILSEDIRVIRTHDPKVSPRLGKEHLIAADAPVIAYRKQRERLLQGD